MDNTQTLWMSPLRTAITGDSNIHPQLELRFQSRTQNLRESVSSPKIQQVLMTQFWFPYLYFSFTIALMVIKDNQTVIT